MTLLRLKEGHWNSKTKIKFKIHKKGTSCQPGTTGKRSQTVLDQQSSNFDSTTVGGARFSVTTKSNLANRVTHQSQKSIFEKLKEPHSSIPPPKFSDL